MVTIANRVPVARGDIWFIALDDPSDPSQGREQANNRPALVISVTKFNQGPADLAVVIPISKVPKGIPLHVEVNPPEGGLTVRSFIKCEAVRSISKRRLLRWMGRVSDRTMEQVEDRLKILFDLHP